jgi:SAM-dependent methyltransferase
LGGQSSIERFRPVDREVRFALPAWARVGVLVNAADEMPVLEGRPTAKVVLQSRGSELTAAHVGARIERLRANGLQYVLVPAEVYPWLERHSELKRFLRTQLRRIDTAEDVCQIYSLEPRGEPEPGTAEDGLPLPTREMISLVAGWIDPADFYRYGRYAVTWIAEMLARNGVQASELGTVLDFGCGCGRVIRHWPSFTDAALYGSDYNPHLVRWCAQNLPIADFRLNQLEPPLPFEDDSFDFVYSLSIFTHLDADRQVPWMEELVRVTKPGGLLLPTFHGRSRVEYSREHDQYDQIAPGFDAGELVVIEAGQAGSSGCAAYHPERYIREVLGVGLELLDFSPAGALDIQQDAVLFKKPR